MLHVTKVLKEGFAKMTKGGVIMDVVNAEQAAIAEDAGAVSVMALERVPSDIRKAGGVARMADPSKVIEIMDAVDIPVMAKETGCGISAETAKQLADAGVSFIDVEGAGGTSWAAVETYRSEDKYYGELFWDWGIPTAISTAEVVNTVDVPVISSGGIRTGLEAAKAIALGADSVGMALPFLKKSISKEELNQFINKFNDSLRIAMFLVGANNIEELKQSKLVIGGKTKQWLEDRGINTSNYSRR